MTTAGKYQLMTTPEGADYMGFAPQESGKDFSNLSLLPQGQQYGADQETVSYKDKNTGEIVLYNPQADSFTERIANPTYDANNLQTNWQGIKYFYQPPDPNGAYSGHTYYIDPNTNEPVMAGYDTKFFEVDPRTRGGGGFMDKVGDWTASNGWMIPAAMIGAGAGISAIGAEAASGAAGAEAAGGAGAGGSTASSLPSLSWTAPEIGGSATGSSFGSLNAALPSAGSVGGAGMSAALPSGVMIGDGTLGTTIGATYMEAAPGQLALDSFGNAIPASSIGVGGYAPTGTSLTDALKTANNVRKGVSTANNLAKLLSSANGKTGANPQQLASLLGGQSTNFVGQIKGNQNPFLFTSPGQTQATEGTYDVSGSNLANALRKA